MGGGVVMGVCEPGSDIGYFKYDRTHKGMDVLRTGREWMTSRGFQASSETTASVDPDGVSPAQAGVVGLSDMAGGGRTRRRIGIVGHACSSRMGSEPGFTWNWGKHLAAHHDVVVFTHPYEREEIEEDLKNHPIPGLRFEWVELDGTLDPWRNTDGERGIRLHYSLWLRRVAEVIAEVHQRQPLDLIHHVSWGSLNQPPKARQIGLPFVWGPLGGGQTWPSAFMAYAHGRKFRERTWQWMVRLSKWNPGIRSAVKHSNLICATNYETAERVRAMGARRVEMFLDCGSQDRVLDEKPHPLGKAGEMTVVWAGRLEARKALPLALEAMALVKCPGVKLIIAGEGPLRKRWEALAASLNLCDRVRFAGRIPFAQMEQTLRQADLFLFTSLRDSVGSVVMEAMSAGLPVLTLNHQGVAFAIPPTAGIKVAVTQPRETVAMLASELDRLAGDPQLRERLSKGAIEHARSNRWVRRAEQMSLLYEQVLRECQVARS